MRERVHIGPERRSKHAQSPPMDGHSEYMKGGGRVIKKSMTHASPHAPPPRLSPHHGLAAETLTDSPDATLADTKRADKVVKWAVKFEESGELHRYTTKQIQEKFCVQQVWVGLQVYNKARGVGHVLTKFDDEAADRTQGDTAAPSHQNELPAEEVPARL